MSRQVILIGDLKNCAAETIEVSSGARTATEILADLTAQYPSLKNAFWGYDNRPLVIVVLDGRILEKRQMDQVVVENNATIRIYPIIGGG